MGKINTDYTLQQVINIYKNYNYNLEEISRNYTKEHLIGMYKAVYGENNLPNGIVKMKIIRYIYQLLFSDKIKIITDITE